MDAPLLTPHDLIRPWKRATVVASLVAAAELILLLGAGTLLLAKPVAHEIQRHALSTAAKPAPAPAKKLQAAIHRALAPAGRAKPRHSMKVMVFNGNGRSGAAGSEAGKLQGLGYRISGTGNAAHMNYATTVVMYKPGFRAEGMQLAKDLGVKVVGPLDGMHAAALHGGELAVIVGA